MWMLPLYLHVNQKSDYDYDYDMMCNCDASHQVSAQSDLGFGRCRLKNFKMATVAAILDIGME